MKERPILMASSMVRATLADTKTQTRRVVEPQPGHPAFKGMLALDDEGIELFLHDRTLARAIRCPYGKPGDRLWVREAWAKWGTDDQGGEGPSRTEEPIYRADGDPWDERDKWRPSIHMPRWASRITLEVTGVRVERLQDISDAEVIAEGAKQIGDCEGAFVAGYRRLWNEINGLGSWDLDPYVWVISFKRLDAARGK